jgi:pyruvate/2-oxoglutarate/acetoin dehydrogenase E1 component
MNYLDEVKKGMNLLAAHPKTRFIGQAVQYKGTAITHQISHLPDDKLMEMPVAEDFQAGFSLGLALRGVIPVSIYPRMNFLLLALNQIINHIDKWSCYPLGQNFPKIIFKTVVGSRFPLDPGPQHKANYAQALRDMVTTINISELLYPEEVVPAYRQALIATKSTIIIEHGDLYK